jgi:hypothetical protein
MSLATPIRSYTRTLTLALCIYNMIDTTIDKLNITMVVHSIYRNYTSKYSAQTFTHTTLLARREIKVNQTYSTNHEWLCAATVVAACDTDSVSSTRCI